MSARAEVLWIAGPVLRARCQGAFALRESVAVGPQALLGEVVRLEGAEILVQVYEDTTGLRPGIEVIGSGLPLAVELGPALLGGMFDGLLRPLGGSDSAFVRPGIQRDAIGESFEFLPRVEVGDRLAGGQWIADARRPGGPQQRVLVPPDLSGEVAWIAPAGPCPDSAEICRLRMADGAERGFAMRQAWPVRTPRPVRRRLPQTAPLVTGQRILDSLFPVALGGKAAIPGGFGTGKTVLLEAVTRGCSADVIIYLGCGERGNEIAGVLEEFPTLVDPRNGHALMERTVLIANTSNMPVAAREASIYSAVTVAEYFRDQGLHVALMADSTSRWAEALREVSGRFGELPGEGGYPAYLASRLADFYERAALVETLSGDIGSVTLVGAISPPSGDFAEPVTNHTKRYVKAFWQLDLKRAQARFYPAVHPLRSYSEDAQNFSAWWAAQGFDGWWAARRRVLALLEEQARLERMARIIGKDALPPRQQLTLLNAELVNDAFLRQSAFSPVDRIASPARQAAMLHLLARWMDRADAAMSAGAALADLAALPCLRPLTRMGEEIGDAELDGFQALQSRLEQDFDSLMAGLPGAANAPAAAG
ncbi:MAG: V-type ATP synthase subunit A [Rhodanobacteraceae bacterium]|nr:V-type ATP synthase subunit A [Rhodanobacteraceae bacterium]